MGRRLTILAISLLLTVSVSAQRYRTLELKSICNDNDWELAPVLYDSGMVFISNRIRPSTSLEVNQYGPKPRLYYSEFDNNGMPDKPVDLPGIFQLNGSEGPITFARNYQIACFCKPYENNGVAGNTGLFISYRRDGEWLDEEPFNHNDPTVNFTTPNLSEDGSTLYFAADGLEGESGNWDLYVSHYYNGEWTAPESLGDNINTPETEMFPFFHSKTGRLYFSSRGHAARGGSFDLFYSNRYKGQWTTPVAVPSPLNTNFDEISLIINEDLSQGYFTRRTGNDYDIFVFSYPNYEKFQNPRPILRNRLCYRIWENSLDTIDYETFSYEWTINDTLHLPGHDVKYCFPGPGKFNIILNVTNKITDTVMMGVVKLFLDLKLNEQPVITAPDTVYVDQAFLLNAFKTNWDRWDIEGYYWDFGNGVQDKGEEVTYQYPVPGDYRIILGIKESVRNRRYEPEKQAVYKDIIVLPRE